MSRALDDLAPVFRPLANALLAHATEADIMVKIICTGRTQAEQDADVARKASRVAHSKHQDGLAIDICPFQVWLEVGPDKLQWDTTHPSWPKLGAIGEALGLRWGGRFAPLDRTGMGWDAGHFEYRDPAEQPPSRA